MPFRGVLFIAGFGGRGEERVKKKKKKMERTESWTFITILMVLWQCRPGSPSARELDSGKGWWDLGFFS